MHISQHTQGLQQSGIRAASSRCRAIQGINLGQGICDMPTPPEIVQAAHEAMLAHKNTYSACEGLFLLREKIAEKSQVYNKLSVDPAKNVLVTHGSSGAFVCAAQVLFEPGDEVILFEPFYGYHQHILQLLHVHIKTVPIHLHDFSIDIDQLAHTISPKTRAIVICTPNNPSGKVYTEAELLAIGALAKKHNLMIITDEIYEYITYDDKPHVSLASLDDFNECTLTISGLSKTYNMTGWRLGYVLGPEKIIEKMALVQDLLYVCPATPLQYAALAAFELPASYYTDMQQMYQEKRDLTVQALKDMGFHVTVPQGAYYIMADFSALGFQDDLQAADILLEKAHVATVTGRSFFSHVTDGQHLLRICYALNKATITQGLQQMKEVLL